ncbi:site-specific integrase [Niabella beijingensis]|uniref:site-specific integrase n=1 Tax=Niabella beijingensis TaxID=2872700 RepID=UPI001CBF2820|nr:site-specific integrase [Niabella beijingensis]MBZ4190730.1 site-specific integrase [Niabella beijingensis]
MLEKSIGLLFFLKKPKNYKKGSPKDLYLKVTVDGIPRELSCKRKWDPHRWSPKANKAIGAKEDAKELNNYLDTLRTMAYEAKRQLLDRGKMVTAGAIRNKISGAEEHSRKLLVLFKKHNDEMKKMIGNGVAKGTWTNFNASYNHTEEFIKFKYKVNDINILALDMDFIKDFYNWFLGEKQLCRNSALKNIANMKKIVLDAKDRGWLLSDPFAKFDNSRDEVNPTFLTMVELGRIAEKEIANERLRRVRDVFVFCCFTGLAFIDVKQLKRNEIVQGFDGEFWISKDRQKEGVLSQIPLLPICVDLLKKYENDPVCLAKEMLLPVLSNQKYNEYLKEIAAICNIEKELTSHVARHTFATAVTLANGVPITSVKDMLGHKTLKQTLHYARVLPIQISEDMRMLRARLLTIGFNGQQVILRQAS